jgi:putative endonuclease
MDTKELGNLGEKLACEYLVENGYKIIGKNYRINFGEIDIIARKRWGLLNFFQGKNDKTIHFVEVKSLSDQGKDFFPEQRVDYKKQNKYKRLAEVWLEKNKFSQNYPCQVDIVAVSIDGITGKPKIDYFENIVEG